MHYRRTLHLAPSSSLVQDVRFSACKHRFKSGWGYHHLLRKFVAQGAKILVSSSLLCYIINDPPLFRFVSLLTKRNKTAGSYCPDSRLRLSRDPAIPKDDRGAGKEKKMRLVKGAGLILPILFLVSLGIAYAQGEGELLLDDFEGAISGGLEGTVDYGSGNGSSLGVAASPEVKYHGQQALEVSFDALSGGYIGVATNNTAEYTAIVEALKWLAKNHSGSNLVFYLDSQLASSQLNGIFKVKNAKIRELIMAVRVLESQFKGVIYKHIKREQNKEADRLVNEALDEKSSIFE